MHETLAPERIQQKEKKTQIKACDLAHILDDYAAIQVLSLDCFDTLLWRKTAAPKDVFTELATRPLARQFNLTAEQRIDAAAKAYRHCFVTDGHYQISLKDIYRHFTSLTEVEQNALIEEEIKTEIDLCFAFQPFVDLIRKAKQRELRVIIVSDMYLTATELTRLLKQHLPEDVMAAIDAVYTSCDFKTSKGERLFPAILEKLKLTANDILHIGDHPVSDFKTPQQLGFNALHFLQFESRVTDFLRMQQAASALTVLAKETNDALHVPRYSPFRPVFATAELQPYAAETLIGYMSFGPVLYAYAKFLTDEVEALQKQGKRVKVFFLLRDAYLLSRAVEAYTRQRIGKLVRIRKFVAVAASFKTQADIDYYISGIKPEYYHFNVICEQLLLPEDITTNLIQLASGSSEPQKTFHQLLHQANVMQIIFEKSAAYRERLKRYMVKEMGLEAGDTVVLADTGFVGVTQDYLTRTFQDELKIEITGRYVLASNAPDKPACKSLITTSWCDHGLFEQSCTLKEGAVVDYDEEGNPVHEPIKLSDEQYKRVSALQSECVRFIHDAKTFFDTSGVQHDFSVLQATAHAALQRHVYLPLEEELAYFKVFQHDKDMGYDLKKTVYHVGNALRAVQHSQSPYKLNPYESRAVGLDLAFSALMQRGFKLEMTSADMNVRSQPVKLILARGQELAYQTHQAMYLNEGYYSLILPQMDGVGVGIVFGEHYSCVQLEKIKLLNAMSVVRDDMSDQLIFSEMEQHGPVLLCRGKSSLVMLKPLILQQAVQHYYHIVFRPI